MVNKQKHPRMIGDTRDWSIIWSWARADSCWLFISTYYQWWRLVQYQGYTKKSYDQLQVQLVNINWRATVADLWQSRLVQPKVRGAQVVWLSKLSMPWGVKLLGCSLTDISRHTLSIDGQTCRHVLCPFSDTDWTSNSKVEWTIIKPSSTILNHHLTII